jgi:hypothetical protein
MMLVNSWLLNQYLHIPELKQTLRITILKKRFSKSMKNKFYFILFTIYRHETIILKFCFNNILYKNKDALIYDVYTRFIYKKNFKIVELYNFCL